jgi:hypothetical protein
MQTNDLAPAAPFPLPMPTPTAVRLEALVPIPIPFLVLWARFARRGGGSVAGAGGERDLASLAGGLRRGLLLRTRFLVLDFKFGARVYEGVGCGLCGSAG